MASSIQRRPALRERGAGDPLADGAVELLRALRLVDGAEAAVRCALEHLAVVGKHVEAARVVVDQAAQLGDDHLAHLALGVRSDQRSGDRLQQPDLVDRAPGQPRRGRLRQLLLPCRDEAAALADLGAEPDGGGQRRGRQGPAGAGGADQRADQVSLDDDRHRDQPVAADPVLLDRRVARCSACSRTLERRPSPTRCGRTPSRVHDASTTSAWFSPRDTNHAASMPSSVAAGLARRGQELAAGRGGRDGCQVERHVDLSATGSHLSSGQRRHWGITNPEPTVRTRTSTIPVFE